MRVTGMVKFGNYLLSLGLIERNWASLWSPGVRSSATMLGLREQRDCYKWCRSVNERVVMGLIFECGLGFEQLCGMGVNDKGFRLSTFKRAKLWQFPLGWELATNMMILRQTGSDWNSQTVGCCRGQMFRSMIVQKRVKGPLRSMVKRKGFFDQVSLSTALANRWRAGAWSLAELARMFMISEGKVRELLGFRGRGIDEKGDRWDAWVLTVQGCKLEKPEEGFFELNESGRAWRRDLDWLAENPPSETQVWRVKNGTWRGGRSEKGRALAGTGRWRSGAGSKPAAGEGDN